MREKLNPFHNPNNTFSISDIKETLENKGISQTFAKGSNLNFIYKKLKWRPHGPDLKIIDYILNKSATIDPDETTPLWGIILETRNHPFLELVIKNFVARLNIPVQLFHGTGNENFINYNDIDGLGNHGFRPGSGTLTTNGEIIFGGLQGLDIIRYEDIETNSVLPKVYFTEIEAFDSRANKYHPGLSRKLIDKVDKIDLPPEISLVTLGFSGLNYRKPEKNRYAYRLAGITDEWTFIEDRRYVTFSELAPGQYSLQVKAANNDGKWSEDPTEMTINVIPGFYQTRAFKALLVLGLGLGIYFFYRYRVRRVTRRNKLLEERVRARTKQIEKERDEKAILLKEIHHRVKNNLQIVNSLLRLQSHYVKDEEALWALDESQNRVMSMAMIHERMYKTENLANINIPDYIRDLCTDIISTYDVTNSVTLDVNVEVEKLNLDTLTPLGLIINEISSNAMKYAFPDDRTGTFKVHLSALDPGKRFKLVIGDDGVGMPHDLTNTEIESLGTILMESLSEQLNGTLTRMDGEGTMYEMIFEQIHV